MGLRLVAVGFDALEPSVVGRFWGELLGREVVGDGGSVLVDGEGGQVGLRFVRGGGVKMAANRMHLHVTSASVGEQERTVVTALRLGAAHLDVGQRVEEGHVVLADPEGNEFCVIEPGNAYLAGCGPLGEVACDGGREVGLFWSAALGWPLVWDRGQETAVQSPVGGTKIGWGGPGSTAGGRGQRFELAGGRGEVDRLVGLGASWREERADGVVVLDDPGGGEFWVREG